METRSTYMRAGARPRGLLPLEATLSQDRQRPGGQYPRTCSSVEVTLKCTAPRVLCPPPPRPWDGAPARGLRNGLGNTDINGVLPFLASLPLPCLFFPRSPPNKPLAGSSQTSTTLESSLERGSWCQNVFSEQQREPTQNKGRGRASSTSQGSDGNSSPLKPRNQNVSPGVSRCRPTPRPLQEGSTALAFGVWESNGGLLQAILAAVGPRAPRPMVQGICHTAQRGGRRDARGPLSPNLQLCPPAPRSPGTPGTSRDTPTLPHICSSAAP